MPNHFDPYGKRRHGLYSAGKLAGAAKRVCAFEGCQRQVRTRGDFCQSCKTLSLIESRQHDPWEELKGSAIAALHRTLAAVYSDDDPDAVRSKTGVEYRR